MSIVEINNLVKKYGDNVAVNDLSLNIDSKGVYGFLGPNGAGKSTTMNVLTGYIGATSGTVIINGYDIFKEPEEAKKNVGYLPEIPPLYQDMTVYEYLEFVSKIKKIKKEERKACIEQSLEMTRTTEVRERLIRNLSKGYKQRVGIAQAIMGMPDLIILDEPTVGLDPKQIIEIRDLIRNLGKEQRWTCWKPTAPPCAPGWNRPKPPCARHSRTTQPPKPLWMPCAASRQRPRVPPRLSRRKPYGKRLLN